MSKLSKRVDKLESTIFAMIGWGNLIAELQKQVATLEKQIRCDCSEFEVMWYTKVAACDLWYMLDKSTGYKRVCLSCGLETTYASEEDAMKDKDTLLKAKVLKLEAERKSLKGDK